MKARLLKKMLGNTGYIVHGNNEFIYVGSPYMPKAISLDKKSLKLRFATDAFNEGRKAIRHKELGAIWDKLGELVASGEIQGIINGDDELETKLPVFYFKDGQIYETHTDKYNWPNVTFDGRLMYENEHFSTKKKAIQRGIEEYGAGIELCDRRKSELLKELSATEDAISKYEGYVNHLKSL